MGQQQWTRALQLMESSGISTARTTANRKDAKPRTEILESDVLTLCESGDLLLLREQTEHASLHIAIDTVVARDISRMQHGEFPTQRVTSLPGACSLSINNGKCAHHGSAGSLTC